MTRRREFGLISVLGNVEFESAPQPEMSSTGSTATVTLDEDDVRRIIQEERVQARPLTTWEVKIGAGGIILAAAAVYCIYRMTRTA